jgi:dipeptidyl aminopeptidase/acylaminoacyl peptidase
VKLRAQIGDVRMSPDAKSIAFVLTEQRRTDPILRVVDVANGRTVADIGKGWKYPITTPMWSPNSREVYWVSGIGASDQIVKAPATGGSITPVTPGRRTLGSVSYDAAMRNVAYVKATAEAPGEVFVANADGTGERQVSQVNTDVMKQIRIGKSERITYTGVPHNRAWLDELKERGVQYMLKNNAPSGERPEIEALLLYPPDYQPGQKYPMVTYVHGGPHGRYADAFNHEFQMVAATGALVLYTNPRGSTNYGMEFQYMTQNAWGIDDAKDILQAVDLVVQRGLADSSRLAISGGSYGGFMTNWLSAQDQRWKTAITDRSIANWMSFYGVSDASGLVEGEFGGMPWPFEHPDTGSFMLATILSPIVWANQVKAPTLIIHSLNDYRVPFEEGEQWFRALKKHNVPVKLVGFPDSSHGLGSSGEPWLLVRRLNEYVNWFRAYLVEDKPVISQDGS